MSTEKTPRAMNAKTSDESTKYGSSDSRGENSIVSQPGARIGNPTAIMTSRLKTLPTRSE